MIESKYHDYSPPCGALITRLQLKYKDCDKLNVLRYFTYTMALYSPVQVEPNGKKTADKKETMATTFASPLSK